MTLELPPLHRGQLELENDGKRFQVVVCGRRWGKTTYGVRKCLKGALQGGTYWWIAPQYSVASIGWRMLKRITAQIPGCEVREADRCVILPNEGSIWIKSADNPDSLRGEKLAGVVFDEFTTMKPETWFEVIRPALSDTKGWAVFIGTPKGKNWAYQLWRSAQVRKNWSAYRKPTIDNPYIDPREVEDARLDMSDEQFKQEYEADFGASQYLVFPEFAREIHEWPSKDLPVFVRYHAGLDFGGTSIDSHKSTGVLAGLTDKDELIIIAEFEQSGPQVGERQLEWMSSQLSYITSIYRTTRRGSTGIRWRADKSQMWGIQLVRKMGFNIVMSKGGKDSIQMGIELVHRRLKVRPDAKTAAPRPRLYYMRGLKYVPEALERYRYPEPAGEDHLQPKVPLSVNDDTMAAIRYMVEDVDYGVVGDPHLIFKNVLARVGR